MKLKPKRTFGFIFTVLVVGFILGVIVSVILLNGSVIGDAFKPPIKIIPKSANVTPPKSVQMGSSNCTIINTSCPPIPVVSQNCTSINVSCPTAPGGIFGDCKYIVLSTHFQGKDVIFDRNQPTYTYGDKYYVFNSNGTVVSTYGPNDYMPNGIRVGVINDTFIDYKLGYPPFLAFFSASNDKGKEEGAYYEETSVRAGESSILTGGIKVKAFTGGAKDYNWTISEDQSGVRHEVPSYVTPINQNIIGLRTVETSFGVAGVDCR